MCLGRTSRQRWLALLLCTPLALGCGDARYQTIPVAQHSKDYGVDGHLRPADAITDLSYHRGVAPLRRWKDLNPDKVQLGKQLFHDPRLSRDNSISCASCHDVTSGGDDGRPVSLGIDGQFGSLNAPTVLNSSLSIAQFWDGRAPSLEEQVAGPIHNPVEMGSDWGEVVEKLSNDPEFERRFQQAYPQGINAETISDAIATYERALITIDSPFDNYLRGDESAISSDAKEGYKLFCECGCISCHQGRALGGNMYQTFGVMRDYFSDDEKSTISDNGRYNVTMRDQDLHRFKVPTLRNIALTAPYFHNGDAETLEAAVSIMASYQLGVELDSTELHRLIAFLQTLTGEIEEELR